MDKLRMAHTRGLLARLRGQQSHGVAGELRQLHERIDALEEQVREGRRHQQRLAELTDVVQELLLPVAQRDQDRVDEVLATYVDHLA